LRRIADFGFAVFLAFAFTALFFVLDFALAFALVLVFDLLAIGTLPCDGERQDATPETMSQFPRI
jgi:hypothetical protein